MIKAAGKTVLGQPLLFLGLSGENVARLAAGEPIRVTTAHLAQLGLPAMMEIVIHYGRTEAAILDELKAHGVNLNSGGRSRPTALAVRSSHAGAYKNYN